MSNDMIQRWRPPPQHGHLLLLTALLLVPRPISALVLPPKVGGPSSYSVQRVHRSRVQRARAFLVASDLFELPSVEEKKDSAAATAEVDNRPYAQRVARPRQARRLNHAYKYLYRHEDDHMPIHDNSTGRDLSSLEFLMQYGGYTRDQVLNMNRSFPPLLDLDVRRHLRPKMRFLQETLCDEHAPGPHGFMDKRNRTLTDEVHEIPPQYFGARLERTIAPRHAFLVYQGLPHGRQLLDETEKGGTLWQDFLSACRKTKQFCALCNTWRHKYPSHPMEGHSADGDSRVTAKQIEAFDFLFQRGLMAAARDELCQYNNSWPLQHINITSGEMIELLVQHGANPIERDVRGASLLHWAAGCGNLDAVKRLLPYFSEGVLTEAERDGATPLHWAVAGANAREFGIGGHVNVCRYLLEEVQGVRAKDLSNKLTKDGNSVLMWAAWSGTLDAVKMLIRNRADPTVSNRNGCTVAHWASSGGNLEVCKYLHDVVGVGFTVPNYGGNTPLTHAVAFGRVDVVDWLRNEVCNSADGDVAAQLAQDFVGWEEGNDKRKQVLSLFDDWYGHDAVVEDTDDDDDGMDYY